MTEQEWLTATDPTPMLLFLQAAGRLSDRRWWLFNAACCRALSELLEYPESQRAVELGELRADDHVSPEVLREAAADANGVVAGVQNDIELDGPIALLYASEAAHALLLSREEGRLGEAPFQRAARALAAVQSDPVEMEAGYGWWNRPDAAQVRQARDEVNRRGLDAALNEQVDLLRCIFGNPFRPPTVEPAWRTPTVVAPATTIYADRTFDQLPILAEALVDAGCGDAELLGHLRSDTGHVRGCWALDLVLGKE